jgi:hypothetical protein
VFRDMCLWVCVYGYVFRGMSLFVYDYMFKITCLVLCICGYVFRVVCCGGRSITSVQVYLSNSSTDVSVRYY